MSKESQTGISQEAAELYAAAIASGSARRLSPQQLHQLADVCESKNTMIDSIEALEIIGDSEVTRCDFGVFEPDEDYAGRLWSERVRASCDEARVIAKEAAAHKNQMIFEVYLDWE